MKTLLVLALLAPAAPGPSLEVTERTVAPEAVTLRPGGSAQFRLHVVTDVAATGRVTPVDPSGQASDQPCEPADPVTGAGEALDMLCTVEPSAQPGTWTVPLKLSAPGRGSVAVVYQVEVRRDTSIIGFSAVKKGDGKLAFEGLLTRFNGTKYVPYKNQPVLIAFRAQGANWDLALQTKSGPDGRFSVVRKPRASGHWHAVFPGNAKYAKSTSLDRNVEKRLVRRAGDRAAG